MQTHNISHSKNQKNSKNNGYHFWCQCNAPSTLLALWKYPVSGSLQGRCVNIPILQIGKLVAKIPGKVKL